MGCNFDDEILEEYFMIANQHVHVLDEFNNFMEEEIYQMMVATTEDQDELILENTTTLKVARWWNRACDIIPCNGGKDIGIQKYWIISISTKRKPRPLAMEETIFRC